MKTTKNKEFGKKSIALFMILLVIATTFAFVMPMESVGAQGSGGSQEKTQPSNQPTCNIGKSEYDKNSRQIKVEVTASNILANALSCTLKCDNDLVSTMSNTAAFGSERTLQIFSWNAGSLAKETSCTVNCKYKINTEDIDCGSATVPINPGGGTVPQPSTGASNQWWQIPCLGFLKSKLEPKTANQVKGKWRPFTSWVDVGWFIFSFAWALGFTFGLGGEFKCLEEQPLEEDACNECEADPLRICTQERCSILGKNCIPVERDDGKGYHCFKGECKDTDLAKVTKIDFKWYTGTDFEPAGSDSANSNQLNVQKQLPWNVTRAFLSITQDKEAKCRYVVDTLEANFSEMNDFNDNEKYPITQSIDISMSEIKTGEHYIFIKCRNKCNVANPAEDDNAFVKFKIAEIPEGIPPIIEYINPVSYSFIDDRQKNLTIEMWLNENVATKAGCVYSTKVNNLTTNWSLMIPFEGPHGDGNNSVVRGWCVNNQDCRYIAKKQCAHCFLNLDLTKGFEQLNETLAELLRENFTEMNLSELLNTESGLAKYFNFVFRCQDTNGNKNEGDPYSILTIPPYNVYVIEPKNLHETYERENIPIEVETYGLNATGGNVSRSTYCRYKVLDGWPKQPLTIPGTKWDDLQPIDELLAPRHVGRINKTLNPATYTMFVRCRDLARIEIANWSYFKILKDDKTPIVVRIYHDTTAGDYLVVETNEESECVYGTSDTIKCNYNFSDGSAMTTTDNYLHAAYWQLDNLYYIKCKDKWDNYPGGSPAADVCTITINPYELPEF